MPMFDQGSDANHDKYVSAAVISAQTGVSATWEWLDVKVFNGPGSLDIVGTGGDDTIQLRGSNSELQPANDAAEHAVGADITADGLVAITIACRWLAVRKSAVVSSTSTTVIFHKAGQGR